MTLINSPTQRLHKANNLAYSGYWIILGGALVVLVAYLVSSKATAEVRLLERSYADLLQRESHLAERLEASEQHVAQLERQDVKPSAAKASPAASAKAPVKASRRRPAGG